MRFSVDHAESVLAALQSRAEQRDDLEAAWKAAVGAIEILMWTDELSAAAALSERTMLDLGECGTALNDQVLPFTTALTCADAYAGELSGPRFRAAAARVPSDSVLGERLGLFADQATRIGALESLSQRRPWDKPGKKPGRADRTALDNRHADLPWIELRRVWGAVMRINDYDHALLIHDELGYPQDWQAGEWFAKWSVHTGHTERASTALLAAREHYSSYAPWSLLPLSPADPDLRPALTTEVRQAFLADVRTPDLPGE